MSNSLPENPNPYNNLVLYVQGGLGKVIMSTAVIRSYKAAFPKAKIVVVSGYPEVFINNPDVYRFFGFATPYLWQDYYGNPEWKVYAQDPYLNELWIKDQPIHLIDLWCLELGVPSIQREPLLHFSGAEVEELASMIKTEKPLVCVQSSGGSKPDARSWTRNPPTYELDEYLSRLSEDNFIAHICLPETPILSSAHQRIETLNRRQAMCLMYYANKVIGIDSYALHARVANPHRGESIFFWPLADSVQKLGYEGNNITNIIPREEVNEIIRNHADYFSYAHRLGIENSSDNCPIAPGVKWFDI